MDAEAILERIDRLETRCPKLGHQVAFSYCRQERGGLPCARTLACWQPRFPVELVLRRTVTEADWNRIFVEPPKSRIDALLDAIDRATGSGP